LNKKALRHVNQNKPRSSDDGAQRKHTGAHAELATSDVQNTKASIQKQGMKAMPSHSGAKIRHSERNKQDTSKKKKAIKKTTTAGGGKKTHSVKRQEKMKNVGGKKSKKTTSLSRFLAM